MKKSLLFLGGTLAGTMALAAAHEWIYRALIYADFKIPEALGKTMSESKPVDGKDRIRLRNMLWLEEYGYERNHIINADGNKLTG